MQRRKNSKNQVLKEGEYERSNGTFEYKWRDKTGKRHSVYAKTLEQLREKEIDILKNTLDGIRIESNRLTLNDLFIQWKQLKKELKDNTYRNYIYMYEQFAFDNIGKTKIKDLKRTDVRAFYNNLYDEKHLKVRTIECLHTAIHQVLEFLLKMIYSDTILLIML